MALYAVARIYWVVFSGAFSSHVSALRGVFVGFGVLTCLVGGIMCYVQTHVKRMLAFSTVSHVGVMVVGFGLLTPLALTGMAMDVMGHAMVKSALFLCSGIVLHRLGEVDEMKLRGLGSRLKGTGIVFALGGLGLAGLPPFGTFVGDSLIEASARPLGLAWLTWIIIAAAALTGAAVLRFVARVFWGWGYDEKEAVKGAKVEEGQETEKSHYRIPIVMIGPAVILIVMGVAVGLSQQLLKGVEASTTVFQNRHAYIAEVLGGAHTNSFQTPATQPHVFGYTFEGLFVVALAFLLVVMTLFRSKLFKSAVPGGGVVQTAVEYLQGYHSGHVGDYVTWLVVGVSVFGGLLIILFK
jgi:multicomponent Na+:H+ antiporter subunit D